MNSAPDYDVDKKENWKSSAEPVGDLSGADKALQLVQGSDRTYEADPVALRALLWKIDWLLMPLMFIADFLQFLDKTTISYANLFGIQADTDMKGNDFAWLGSAFYLGYLLWQPVAAYLLLRLPFKLHLTVVLVVWGLVLTCTGACTNFIELCVCRVLLGMSESAMVPILSAVTGSWYTREEQATRTGIWYSAVGPAQIIGGLISYGMYSLDTTIIKKWQFIFYLLGPITIAFGIWVFIALPNSPDSARFLTDDEKVMAIERIRANKTGTAPTGIKWYQVREAFRDPRFYLVAVALLSGSVPNGGITSFGATIIKGFGYSTNETTLLGMSTGALEWVAMGFGIYLSRKTNTRSIPAIVCIAVAVVGALMMVCVPASNINPRFAGYVLVFAWPIGQMMMVSWLQSMISGHSKRTTFYACYQICYAAGNIVGSQTYRPKDAPDYLPAKIGMLACLVLHLLCFAAIAAVNWNYNRLRDRDVARHGEVDEVENIEFMDKTDFEMKSFRYPL